MKSFVISLCLLLAGVFSLCGQTIPDQPVDSSIVRKPVTYRVVRDSAYYARQKFVTDSIITHTWILPDSLLNSSIIIDSIMREKLAPLKKGEAWYTIHTKAKKESLYKKGKVLPKGDAWILVAIGFLLLVFAILKRYFSRQLYSIIEAFFSNRVLNNLNKEDNLFTSWPFLLLFVHFGFTIGMFCYLVTQYYQLTYGAGGFKFYVTISVLIVLLFGLKIFFLKMLGHLFNIQKAVHEYITVLYLSYFNTSLLFIPLVIAFALSSMRYGFNYIIISSILVGLVFIFQFFRAGVNILSHYRFPKVYLFLYFCALEICPILILIKTVGL